MHTIMILIKRGMAFMAGWLPPEIETSDEGIIVEADSVCLAAMIASSTGKKIAVEDVQNYISELKKNSPLDKVFDVQEL